MTPKLKKIIIIVLAAVVLFIVYAVFIKKDPTTPALINTGEGLSADAQVLGNQISQALLRIEQIKLDKGIFTNNIYRTLIDRSEPISEEPIGRANPFALIGDVSVSSNTRLSIPTATSTPRTSTSTNTTATSSSSILNN
jgi:hypothetical protein